MLNCTSLAFFERSLISTLWDRLYSCNASERSKRSGHANEQGFDRYLHVLKLNFDLSTLDSVATLWD